MPRPSHLSAWAWTVVLLLAPSIGACAGSGGEATVATVGGRPITRAVFTHWLSIENASVHATTPSARAGAKRRVLESLISAEWTLAQASKLGVSVSAREAEQQLSVLDYAGRAGLGNYQLLADEAKLEKALSAEALTHADRVWLVKLNLLATKVQRKERLLAEQRISMAEVARYYEEHREQFVVPEERDYVFIPTFTKANAQKARKEIEAGKDFASVWKRFSIDPPELGGLRHLKRGEGLPVFTARVFRARPHVLLGPAPLGQIWDVYEVRGIRPRHRQPLAQAEAAIRRHLAGREPERGPVKLAEALARSWKARTRCSVGYVVSLCGAVSRPG